MQIPFYIAIFSSFTILLPFVGVFILCFATRKEILNRDIFAFALYTLIITIAQSLITIYSFAHKVNYIFFNIFQPIEFAFFLYILSLSFARLFRREWIIAAVCLLSCYAYIIFTGSINLFPYQLLLLESALVVPLIFYSYVHSIRANGKRYFYTDLIFKGMLIFTLANLILIAFINILQSETLVINSVLNIYANGLFFKSLLTYRREINGR